MAASLRILGQFAKALQAGARQSAQGSLLNTIGECAHQEVAAKSGRLAAKQAAPFGPKGDDACLFQNPDLAFDRSRLSRRRRRLRHLAFQSHGSSHFSIVAKGDAIYRWPAVLPF